ncbi:TlpA family protein disulfide reductase [Kitasatospora sp. NPDC058965]|uniref:TlpA family protein disulfide reductase n=1 Tax=Kitasatospora sp. NPDC058965 TaxID=3346682 RepID=UPI0036B26D83
MPGTHRFRTAALLAAVTTVLTLAGCGTEPGGDAQAAFVSGSGGLDTVPPAGRRPAPAISGNDLEGRPVSLQGFAGKVVVVNLWGSWCSACRAEAKGLELAFEKYRDQGVQFLGINTRDTDVTNAEQFESGHGIGYPSIFDPDGTQILKFPKGSLNPEALPTTLVVDRQGRLAARAMKAVSVDDLDALISPLLAEH